MSSRERTARWAKRKREKGLAQVSMWIPVGRKSVVIEAVITALAMSGQRGNESVAGGDRAMSCPDTPDKTRTLPDTAGSRPTRSFQSGKPGDGFAQSEDEYRLDTLAPRTKETLLAELGRIDQSGFEPETAEFLRGYMLGKCYQFCPDDAGEAVK